MIRVNKMETGDYQVEGTHYRIVLNHRRSWQIYWYNMNLVRDLKNFRTAKTAVEDLLDNEWEKKGRYDNVRKFLRNQK